MISLESLRSFVHVVDTGTFSEAARRIGVTQPAVSAQMRTLANHFGRRLLERDGQTWRPTDAGRRLYDHATRLLDAASAMEEELATTEQPSGPLRVVASTVPGEFIVPDLLGRFCERYPDVRITVEVTDTARALDLVLARRFDAGIVGAGRTDDRVLLEPVFRDSIVLVAPKRHPLAKRGAVEVHDLTEHALVVREEGSGTREVVFAALRDAGVDVSALNIAMELGSSEAIKRAVAAGAGLGFLSPYALHASGERHLEVVEVKGLRIERPLYLATERAHRALPALDAFHTFLTSEDVTDYLEEWRCSIAAC